MADDPMDDFSAIVDEFSRAAQNRAMTLAEGGSAEDLRHDDECYDDRKAKLLAAYQSVREENARMRAELAMREDSDITAMGEATDAITRALDKMDEGEDWQSPRTGGTE